MTRQKAMVVVTRSVMPHHAEHDIYFIVTACRAIEEIHLSLGL